MPGQGGVQQYQTYADVICEWSLRNLSHGAPCPGALDGEREDVAVALSPRGECVERGLGFGSVPLSLDLLQPVNLLGPDLLVVDAENIDLVLLLEGVLVDPHNDLGAVVDVGLPPGSAFLDL